MLNSLEKNFLQKSSFYPKAHPFMKVLDFEGIVLVDSLLATDTFNVALGGDFTREKTYQAASFILNYFTQQNLPFAWWLGPTTSTKLADNILSSLGMTLNEQEVGMTAQVDQVNFQVPTPKGLVIEQVNTVHQLRDFGSVLASIFNPFDENVIKFYEMISPFLEKIPLHAFVGYIDQLPVTAGSLVLEANCAGIYDIATHPDHRRKGCGTYMTSYLLKQAKEMGYKNLVLLASSEGQPIYQKFGFTSVGTFNVYGNGQLLSS